MPTTYPLFPVLSLQVCPHATRSFSILPLMVLMWEKTLGFLRLQNLNVCVPEQGNLERGYIVNACNHCEGWWCRFSSHSSVIDNWWFKPGVLALILSDCWLLFFFLHVLFPTEARGCFTMYSYPCSYNTAIQPVNIIHTKLGKQCNIQSTISTFFLHYSCTLVWKRCRDGALYIYLHFYKSSLPCLHTFWHAIPTFLLFYLFINLYTACIIIKPVIHTTNRRILQ